MVQLKDAFGGFAEETVDRMHSLSCSDSHTIFKSSSIEVGMKCA